MTLRQRFSEFTKQEVWENENKNAEECELIADDYAIEFAEWCDNEGYTQVNNLSLWKSLDDEQGKYSKELLEIFKKEKGL